MLTLEISLESLMVVILFAVLAALGIQSGAFHYREYLNDPSDHDGIPAWSWQRDSSGAHRHGTRLKKEQSEIQQLLERMPLRGSGDVWDAGERVSRQVHHPRQRYRGPHQQFNDFSLDMHGNFQDLTQAQQYNSMQNELYGKNRGRQANYHIPSARAFHSDSGTNTDRGLQTGHASMIETESADGIVQTQDQQEPDRPETSVLEPQASLVVEAVSNLPKRYSASA
ncbi:uncharacterized protein RCC_07633 [Ramularia collo-cygni]|uniref:Uncharacterized protein n=1 Tax=Ramularia collo-cygni TaxID=112498 RepID=A0A2D3V1T4_9PEZI|nr:uncharacterized protein RCC_07633 [Ramularia collo-cygni]CZT21768.1 uncharacterized protein RCC_07633 [Ramularia collo-cygni]